jgi:actin-like ATPase involved in cell morphogenesis
MIDIQKASADICRAILSDVTDRRGWRQAWDSFDEDIQREIKNEHTAIILKILKKHMGEA